MQRPLSRVLVVDDAGLFRLLESSFLKRLGCEIVRATDGPDVIRKASATGPDLILLDAQKPGLDGEA
ncbi:MAG TPA: response regulator, partial [Candidatus Binatia bacterium]|nr:response regulator [Candidatus Binatia bacterium]